VLSLARRALRIGARDGLVLHVPHITLLKERAPRAGFVTEPQLRSIVRHLPADLACVAWIGFTLGWRLSEILNLRREDVDLEAGALRIKPGGSKNSEGRIAYLPSDVLGLVRAQVERVDHLQRTLGRVISAVFPLPSGRLAGQPRQEIRYTWDKAARSALLPGVLFHDLRRSAVRRMEQAAVPRSVAMKITGHKSENVYRRYAIASDADLRDAVRRLGTLTGTLAGAAGNGVVQLREVAAGTS